jgi:LAS superfamily LD-carboxypeptidase LdcB
MRIIEPEHLRYTYKQRQRSILRKRLRQRFSILILAVVFLAAIGVVTRQYIKTRETIGREPLNSTLSPSTTIPSPTQPEPVKPKTLKFFTNEQFRDFYNNFAYPNTQEVGTAPEITGSPAADERILAIAEARGYRLRSVPVAALTSNDGFLMQERMVPSWQELKNAAAAEGIVLGIVSSYRSVDEQRAIFMQRLGAAGATVESVAAGNSDTAVDLVLKTTSIPGYSRHHTGYTLDLKCNGQDFNFFATTVCFEWLSKNNYENAKKFGWIPSYPPGITNQGPDPEAWEYVWVGTDMLYQ